jgi:hypothetical protein
VALSQTAMFPLQLAYASVSEKVQSPRDEVLKLRVRGDIDRKISNHLVHCEVKISSSPNVHSHYDSIWHKIWSFVNVCSHALHWAYSPCPSSPTYKAKGIQIRCAISRESWCHQSRTQRADQLEQNTCFSKSRHSKQAFEADEFPLGMEKGPDGSHTSEDSQAHLKKPMGGWGWGRFWAQDLKSVQTCERSRAFTFRAHLS